MSQGPRLNSLLTIQGQQAFVLPLKGVHSRSTFVSFYTNVQTVPSSIKTAPWSGNDLVPVCIAKHDSIVFHELCFELQTYPTGCDRLLLLNGFDFGFSLYPLG